MSSRFQRPAALLALLLAASLALPAQTVTPLNDPANLAGERVSPQDPADTLPINHGALALQQLLRKLRTRASFMLIVAHPDDEDGGMLTYLSRGQGARVAMLTLNRGEGGQNLMSADFEDALGLIRTQELLAADRYMAVDQFFGTEVDFGFSKTKEESFAKWTHERVIYDAVRAVRLYRPLVIASVFIGATSDGHGQHQVAGEIAQEVFNAAGDPNVFPDQIAAGLQPWQPLKVYARVPFARIDAQGIFDTATNQYTPARFTNYVTGKVTSTIPNANVVVPEGTPDPLLGGLSYVQFARQGLALQKSQVGATARPAAVGRADVSYHRYGTHLPGPDGKPQPDGDDSGLESSFFDGIDTTLPGIASLAPDAPPAFRAVLQLIDMKIEEAQKQFDPANLAVTVEPLRIALQTLDTVISGTEGSSLSQIEKTNLLHELRIKRVQLNNALILAQGITLKVTVKQPGMPNAASADLLTTQVMATFDLNISITQSSHDVLGLESAKASVPTGAIMIFGEQVIPLLQPKTELVHPTVLNGGLPVTRPYFSRASTEQPYYDIASPPLRNAPATPDPIIVLVALDDRGIRLDIAGTASNLSQQPIDIVPPVSVALDRRIEILPSDKRTLQFRMY